MTEQIDELNQQFILILAGLEKLTKNINDIEESKLDNYNADAFYQLKIDSKLLYIAAKSVIESKFNIDQTQIVNRTKELDDIIDNFKF